MTIKRKTLKKKIIEKKLQEIQEAITCKSFNKVK